MAAGHLDITVRDSGGHALAGITVSLYAAGTTTPVVATDATDSVGVASFATLAAGLYDAKITVDGVDYWRHGLLVHDAGDVAAPGSITAHGVNIAANYGVVLSPGAAPSSYPEGTLYYDSTAHKLRVYNGSAWETVTSAV